MQSQVIKLSALGIIDTSFIALDSTPVLANTSLNNPKSFFKNKFHKNYPPKSDKDCSPGFYSASNQIHEPKSSFYWGYKNHILIDCITGLPLFELTAPANYADNTKALDILKQTNHFLNISQCTFIADKAYDCKDIYNTVKELYHGSCVIPLNKRNTKNHTKLLSGNPICDAGLAMNKDGKFSENGKTRQKYCCPFKRSKSTSCPCNHKQYFSKIFSNRIIINLTAAYYLHFVSLVQALYSLI